MSIDDPFLVHCDECNVKVQAKSKGTIPNDQRKGPPGGTTLVACPNCDSPMLLEVLIFDYGDEQFLDYGRLYPPDRSQVGRSVPDLIATVYKEAVRCYEASAYIATALMSRRVVEAVALDHLKTKKMHSLYDAIAALEGVLPGYVVEWATGLRLLGNSAAHDVDVEITRETAGQGLDVTAELLRHIYTVREQFLDFKEKYPQLPPDAAEKDD